MFRVRTFSLVLYYFHIELALCFVSFILIYETLTAQSTALNLNKDVMQSSLAIRYFTIGGSIKFDLRGYGERSEEVFIGISDLRNCAIREVSIFYVCHTRNIGCYYTNHST
uniref:Uncharacterized protein n=1 Tax=Cacopsylla melanoneura TaxID=428564 RepID=A0A8D8V883_9HEMI